ncbi:methyltransferase domain-containing protein [Ktedonosporobacter rubrisoli]|uniref:methyltransferase domain-containing protein n=1 Tax=Ktedonosporobacter rubrisoli TaxID=2509675 RepID=UPI0013EE93C8|nr:methyltransferase domain-containing protein [Ktedonosporobacter rubrisoli]
MNNVVHVNECGLPLNAIEWLETHHHSKAGERACMIRDLHLKQGGLVVDAGCGPGLWTPLLAEAIGPDGRIIGVDISAEALVTAKKRSINTWYRHQVQYKRASLEQLPLAYGRADSIFSANVSQYLLDPVATFAAMGPYLAPGGRLIIKDMDLGTLRFYNVDPALQARVFRARELWEKERAEQGLLFEDSWVGSKLAGYLRAAGYKDVQVKTYRIVRRYPLAPDYRLYLEGIAEWFVGEGAPYLSREDQTNWLHCFLNEDDNVFARESFVSEETEYIVTGVWDDSHAGDCLKLSLATQAEAEEVLVAVQE